MLAAWLSGLGGYLPDVSLASQSLARMLRLLQAVGPQPSDGRPLASRGSHVAGCHKHFVHRLTTLASVASRARTSIPSEIAKEAIILALVVYTVISQIFDVVLFSVISVVNGFTEIKKTPKCEKHIE